MNKCPTCKREFIPNPKKKIQTFCSRECWRQSLLKQDKRTCEGCGKEFVVYPARAKARFCSWECYAKPVEKSCAFCGTTFFIKRSHAEKRTTCSRQCATSLRAVQGRSPHQGIPVSEVARQKVSAGLKHYYNGNPQKHWNYKNGPFAQKRGIYSSWKERRGEIRERDHYCCKVCGKSETELGKQLSVHHIKPFRFFTTADEANEPSNLVCLCQSCHMKVEHGTIELSPLIR